METAKFIETYYTERKNTDSLKMDALKERYGDAELLPLWVADTEFSVPETVKNVLSERIAHGIFGYSTVPSDYFSVYDSWQQRHEKTQFKAEWLHFSTGVVQALYDLIDCFTQVDDAVLIQPPVYYPFFNAIKDKQRKLVTNPLVFQDNQYQIDFVDFENKIRDNQVKLFILCSPHNPVGRVWTKNELEKVLTICEKYHVLVISDEIHSDLILGDHQFVSAVTAASENFLDSLIVCNAPSKTFNMATLLNAHIWIPSEAKRDLFSNWSKEHKQTENSSLGQLAAKTAYQTGDDWLESFLAVIEENYDYLKETLAVAIPEIYVSQLEGTYLLWLNLKNWIPEDQVKFYIQEQAGLAIDFGEWFSAEAKSCIRINLATAPQNIHTAVDRLIKVNQNLKVKEA